MPELNDHELLAEFARSESEAAFAALVGRHVNLVYSTALRFTGNPHHAEEITQAVFIILARKAGKLSSSVVLSGWLYQAARLTAANFVKGEIRRHHREQEAYMQTILNEPDAMTWKQIAPLLEEAMGGLGETDRNAVVLRFFENKTAAEVAVALKLTEGTAHKRVNRALEKLRKFFTKRGVSSTIAIIAGTISSNSVQAAPVTLAKSVTAVAVLKGAAASGSTLTLIKGALKIMAWTKMKTTAFVSVAILLAVGTTTVAVQHQYEHRHDALFNRLGEDFMKDPSSVGLSIGFFNNGSSYFYNFGTTEKGKALPPSQNTVYEIGSITKTFVSLVLANAVSERKVKLGDDIRKYLDGNYPNLEYQGKGITLAELANGTSGLPNFLPSILNENGANTREEWYAAAKRFESMEQNDFFAALHQVKLNAIPGSMSKHSNAAAQLLRYIMEGVYKTSIDQLVQRYISSPLEMTNTFFVSSKEQNMLLAKGYDERGNESPYMATSYNWGACGLDSCTSDLVKFIRLQLNTTNELVRLSHEKTFAAGDHDIALTWLIHKHENGDSQLWCDGTTFGFSSYLVIYPELNSGIILLANECDASTTEKLGGIAHEIFKEISQK